MTRSIALALVAGLFSFFAPFAAAQGFPPPPNPHPPQLIAQIEGALLSGSRVPSHLFPQAHRHIKGLNAQGLAVQISASEAFDPDIPRSPPFYSGVFLFSGVYHSQGILLIKTSEGKPFPIGHMGKDSHGQAIPVFDESVTIELNEQGANLVVRS